MRQIVFRSRFKKELKKCVARGLDMQRYQEVVTLLACDQELPARCRPHKLVGGYTGLWECHIAPDWLLIYYPDEENRLILYNTGTHADLFD